MVSGVLSAMTGGTSEMQKSSVECLDLRTHRCPLVMDHMAKAQAASSLIMSNALDWRPI